MRGSKCLPLWLSHELYQRLERDAEAYVRAPEQQALWILRQALGESTPATPAESRQAVEAPHGE
jgi:hypothetical protein